MRRKDRQMDKEFSLGIIDKASYGILSMVDTEQDPYGIPLSIVRDGELLYFHSAKEGKKVDILKENPKVNVTFVGDVNVPENYTNGELDEILKDPSKASLLISKVFTTEYESAIVKGQVSLVEKQEERIKAMELVCRKYTPTKMDYFDQAIQSGLKRSNVYKIMIDEIDGKRKKYDNHGEELKWGK